MAFSDSEIKKIHKTIIQTAIQSASSVGMKKTSLDAIVQTAGISKGSFYKFFSSKDVLFLEVIKSAEQNAFAVAYEVAVHNKDASPCECATLMIIAAFDYLYDTGVLDFIKNNLEYLLNRVSDAAREDYEEQCRANIRTLLKMANITVHFEMNLVVEIIRLLMVTFLHGNWIGSSHPAALKIIVRGCCQELFD